MQVARERANVNGQAQMQGSGGRGSHYVGVHDVDTQARDVRDASRSISAPIGVNSVRPLTCKYAPRGPSVSGAYVQSSCGESKKNDHPKYFTALFTWEGTACAAQDPEEVHRQVGGEPLSRKPVCRQPISLYCPYPPCK